MPGKVSRRVNQWLTKKPFETLDHCGKYSPMRHYDMEEVLNPYLWYSIESDADIR